MACDLETVQANACESGIGKVTDEITLLQITVQHAAEWLLSVDPGADVSVSAVFSRACDSGIGKVTDELLLLRIIAQTLCDACEIDQVKEDACTSGILNETNSVKLWQAIAQLTCDLSGGNCDVDATCDASLHICFDDRKFLLVLIAQLFCEANEGTCTLASLLEGACTSGILKEQSPIALLQVIAQLLCGDHDDPQ